MNAVKTLSIVGAGGHAKVVLDCAKLLDLNCTIHDDNENRHNQCLISNMHVIGPITSANLIASHIAIGDNKARFLLFKRLKEKNATFITLAHPKSIISQFATIKDGSFIAAGAVVEADAVIGECCILNTNCSVNHDCILDSFVHIAPGATLCGNVRVGSRSFIGANATVLPRVSIGSNCIIGAGAVVVRDVPDDIVVIGNPAKFLRKN